MSLNWDLGDIKDWQTKCWTQDKHVKPLKNALIWMTMDVGMGSITALNWEKFFTRVCIVENIIGSRVKKSIPPVMKGKKVIEQGRIEDVFITAQDVYDHIGLYTNVSPESDSVFAKKVMKKLRWRAEREINEWRNDNANAVKKEVTA